MLPNHATQTDPFLHEAKGASTATTGTVLTATGLGTATFQPPYTGGTGAVLRTIAFPVTSTATGTTLIPFDNTVPQNTEGTQFLSASITPATIGNKIRVHAILNGSYSVAANVTAALFQDATANALAAVAVGTTAANQIFQHSLMWEITAASTASTTLAVRVGGSTAGTYTLNGNAGSALFGGTAVSQLTLTEIKG